MELLWRLGYLLGLLAVGVGARQVGVLTERRTEWLTGLAFYVALPMLIFSATYDEDLGSLVSPALVLGVFLVITLTAAAAVVVTTRQTSRARRSVAIVQSYHANLGFLGVPLVAMTLGETATAAASVVLGISLLFHVPLTIILLVTLNDAEASFASELGELARNPVLLSLAAGLAGAAIDLSIPASLATGLSWGGSLALPLAVLGVGASLQLNLAEFDPAATGAVVAMKVGVMPLVAWTVFSTLTVSATAFAAAVLMFGMPTAVSTYVYTSELGGDAEFASVNVFASTVASLGSIVVILQVVG